MSFVLIFKKKPKSSIPSFVYHSIFHQSLLVIFSFYFSYKITEV